jgi:hypothetical protein
MKEWKVVLCTTWTLPGTCNSFTLIKEELEEVALNTFFLLDWFMLSLTVTSAQR